MTSRNPEAEWKVSLVEGWLKAIEPTGKASSVHLDEVLGIAVETNDTGPWGIDFWWLVFAMDGKLHLAFPAGATGEKEVADALLELPGFDHGQFILANRSTDNATFPVWARR